MIWFLSVIVSMAGVEILMRFPCFNSGRIILMTARKSYRIINSSNISDCWKERASRGYAKIIFMQVLRLASCIALLAIALLALLALCEFILPQFGQFIFSVRGLGSTVFFGAVYFLLRRLIVSS